MIASIVQADPFWLITASGRHVKASGACEVHSSQHDQGYISLCNGYCPTATAEDHSDCSCHPWKPGRGDQPAIRSQARVPVITMFHRFATCIVPPCVQIVVWNVSAVIPNRLDDKRIEGIPKDVCIPVS